MLSFVESADQQDIIVVLEDVICDCAVAFYLENCASAVFLAVGGESVPGKVVVGYECSCILDPVSQQKSC